MHSIDPVEAAKVKFSRADLLKLISSEMQAEFLLDIDKTAAAEMEARNRYRAFIVDRARHSYGAVLSSAADAVGSDIDSLHGWTNSAVYINDVDPLPTMATVTFSDTERVHEGSFVINLNVLFTPALIELRDEWIEAKRTALQARDRDIRKGQVNKDARDALIAERLKGDGGKELLAALKAFNKQAKS